MADETWTIERCIKWTVEFLASKGVEHPRVSADWLMGAATGLDRVGIYTSFDRPLTPEELAFMHDGVVRRAKGEPLQYIIGEAPFRSLTVACEPGVLIPRPETEMLVELVLDRLARTIPDMAKPARERTELPWNAEVERAREAERAAAAAEAGAEGAADAGEDVAPEGDAPAAPDTDDAQSVAQDEMTREDDAIAPAEVRVLEVGCGTGCISLALASERPGRVRCIATDISERAVSLAERNRAQLGIDPETVDFRLGDLVAPVTAEEAGTFDALVSNPPYIPTSVMGTLPDEVGKHEPDLALDGGADGLNVFRRLLAAAPAMLKPGALFACELFEDSLEAAAALCRQAGMDEVEIMPDLTGRSRFVLARTPARL